MGGMADDDFEDRGRPQPLWVRAVAVLALVALLGFVVAQVL
jgi:hypothetical protein